MWWEVPWLLLSFCLYLVDQGSDALTAILLLQAGHIPEGVLTAVIILLPGLVASTVELVCMWRGRGSALRAVGLLLLCPLWALLTHLYSLYWPQHRSRALLLKTVEGLVSAGPQLVLQIALFLRGTLTTPVASLLHHNGLSPDNFQDTNLTLFGRDFSPSSHHNLGLLQLASLLLSFLSTLTAALHFNELEVGGRPSAARLCLSLPFFSLTIIFRAVCLGLCLCFLSFWSSVILFLLFFLTLLAALCAGDSFPRAVTYGVWSLLAPVGYARDPLVPLGYTSLAPQGPHQDGGMDGLLAPPGKDGARDGLLAPPGEDGATQGHHQNKDGSRARASYFLSCHLLSSLLILGPALILLTALVQRAALLPGSLSISTRAIFPLPLLSSLFLPLLFLSLGVTMLLARPYITIRDCTIGEKQTYTINH